MLIRFLRDYRGALTGEQFYATGEEVDMPRGAEIVAEGAADPVHVAPADPEAEPDPEAVTEPARRGRRA